MDLQIKDISGKVVGDVTVDDTVWGAEPNDALLHQAVVAQQSNKRQGTQDTLTRAEVSYSTRKLRSQKGSGRARLGSRKSPNLRHGGVAHGPHPRSYTKRLPKKMRRQALRVALSNHVRGESVVILDSLDVDTPKTRTILDMLSALDISGKALLVTAEKSDAVITSCAVGVCIRRQGDTGCTRCPYGTGGSNGNRIISFNDDITTGSTHCAVYVDIRGTTGCSQTDVCCAGSIRIDDAGTRNRYCASR